MAVERCVKGYWCLHAGLLDWDDAVLGVVVVECEVAG